MHSIRQGIKRALDVLLSLLAILLLSPVYLVIALSILMTMGRPILYKQARPGYQAKVFYIMKFRTMNQAADADGLLLPDELRITRLGSFLRRTSLDEIPEFINVLSGDMSLVGPRPLLVAYLPLYSTRQAMRHQVRPGITGWAQVNGRNLLSWEQKFEMDVWYIENWTLLLDFKILFMTVWTILSRKGIAADDHATMPIFTGSPGKDEFN